MFLKLSSVTARFSPYEEDFVYKNVYYTELEVKTKVLKVKNNLDAIKK